MQMAAAERYLDLYGRFAEGIAATGTPVEVSLDELAQVLFCTTRNVKLVLRRMEEECWIRWLPGRGRGNRSQLVFLQERDTMLLELAQRMAQRGEYKPAFELIHTHGKGSPVKDRFSEWLELHFGYRTEVLDGKRSVDTLRLPVHTPIVTLDPGDVLYAFDAHMIKQLFNQLVYYDVVAGRVVPAIAHAWESNKEATVWQFHLRKGVYFHHGHEMTADDVIFSLERLRSGKAHSWLLRSVRKIESVGLRTIRIELEKPNRIFHRFMSSPAASILPRELLESDEEQFWRKPSGTGPFMAGEWNEDRFVLTVNKNYYNGRAHLDGVVIAFMPPEHGDSSRKCWEKLIWDHDLQDQKPEEDWVTVETLCKGCTMLTWNLGKDGPQQSALFRKAVDLLIDRHTMIRELGEDRMYAARGFRPDDNTPLRSIRHDSALARALLRESGYDGTPITLYTTSFNMRDARWIAERCGEHGVVVHIEQHDSNEFKRRDVINEADTILYGILFAQDEVCEIESYEQHGSFLKEHLHPEFRAWARDKIDIALASKTSEERRLIMGEIEDRLREEGHVVFLLHKKTNTSYHPGIKGITMSSLGWIDFKDVWVQSASG
ncbi:ABC transporter substrate-binding protein [Paenibacillus sp. BC26]|uniref:ABC transporter substrate-binding protein n=1 Tax=Paenibacillus sp. BC26 TaxID=1881032 RepID=UPI0008EAC26E|nr:ABC transporter substrate-binding protein [Paenibacillus sp. BC26]SFS53480.1 DNA-binding transcriptional regulator SgrR of sgrS sRNA, contains a MarR-type HTH domain and a solute-binding domain [Paenibacillus sp. BC26]